MALVTHTFKWYSPSLQRDRQRTDSRTASDAEDVYVTGTFDNWSKSNKLEKTAHGTLEKEVALPVSERISYKVHTLPLYASLSCISACLPRGPNFPCIINLGVHVSDYYD
jgi:hypothetical protein